MSAGITALWIADVVVTLVADARWLRVAQREHYRAGRVTAIARLWCGVRRENAAIIGGTIVLTLIGAVGGGWVSPGAFSFIGLVGLLAWPVGLSPKPSSAPLARTPRLRRVALLLLVAQALLLFGCRRAEIGALVPLLAVPVTDLVLLALTPVEARLSRKFVVSAKARLARVRPTVVAITGSYGKTSTKLYAAQLIGASRSVAASPASFNNLMGLSRAVNERLPDGTEVFVAEMGTYGPGEIRELCATFPPDVAAIITIGEAHLERMGDRATIVAAKSEITERPGTVVLNIDVPELAVLADMLAATKHVIRCSTADASADACVTQTGEQWNVSVRGEQLASVPAPPTGHPINLAVAVGLALAVDVPAAGIARSLPRLPVAAHRAEIATTAAGVTIIDDTYNANPTGAAQALRAAVELAGTGRVFTITPGMVELGSRQVEANQQLAAEATAAATMVLAVTGRTNRAALLAGADGRSGEVRTFRDRNAAAQVIVAEARKGDVIVYLNDLPDHYP